MTIRFSACIAMFLTAVVGAAQESPLSEAQRAIVARAWKAEPGDARAVIHDLLALPPEERLTDARLAWILRREPLAEAVDGMGAEALPLVRAFASAQGPAKCVTPRGFLLPEESELLMRGLSSEQIAGAIGGADGVGRNFLLLALARRPDELPTSILPTLVTEMSRPESNLAAAGVFARFGHRAAPVVPELLEALAEYRPTHEGTTPFDEGSRQAPFREAIGNIGPEAVPALAVALRASEASERLDAIRMFAKVRSDGRAEEASQALRAALEDREIEVVREAVKELGARRITASADRLFVLLKEEDRVTREAAWALARIGGRDVVARLCGAMSESDDDRRRAVIAGALAHTKEPIAVEALIAEMERDSVSASAPVAATSLGTIGDPAAIDPLRAALRRRGAPKLQSAAAAATARYGKAASRSYADLVAASEEADDATRLQIALALEAVSDDRTEAICLYKSLLEPLEEPLVAKDRKTVVTNAAIQAADRLTLLAKDDAEVERLILKLAEAELDRGHVDSKVYRLLLAAKSLDTPKSRELLMRCADDERLGEWLRLQARGMAERH